MPDYSLVPVDYQPDFGYSLVPVDYDPFGADGVAQQGQAPQVGRWHEAIEAAVRMEANTSEQIRGMWARNLEVARANNVTLTPQQFAEMFVDSNFPLD